MLTASRVEGLLASVLPQRAYIQVLAGARGLPEQIRQNLQGNEPAGVTSLIVAFQGRQQRESQSDGPDRTCPMRQNRPWLSAGHLG